MSVLSHHNYRTYLREVMSERARRNPRYSLRAMADHLAVAPSFLSGILKGEKNLSLKTSLKIARRLDLSTDESEYFCLLTQLEASREPLIRERLITQLKHYNSEVEVNDMSVDRFRMISEWYHFAILSALELTGFEASARHLALALSVSQAEIELALERLERLQLIELGPRGHWRKKARNPRVESEVPNQALRDFHRQTLTKAIESLETQTPHEKVVGSETFAVDVGYLPEFRALADEFFDKALALAKKSKRRDSVYHLGVQFFNLTPALTKKRGKNG